MLYEIYINPKCTVCMDNCSWLVVELRLTLAAVAAHAFAFKMPSNVLIGKGFLPVQSIEWDDLNCVVIAYGTLNEFN